MWDKKIFSVVVICLLAIHSVQAGSVHSKVKEGNKLFAEGKFDEALNRYQDALLSDPESPLIHYNIGNTLYKKKKYEEAIRSFQKVIGTENVTLEANSYYNMGNCLYRLGKLPESILAYQQALKLNPNDMDAKYNLEYVRRKLKEQAKKQPLAAQQQQQQKQKQDNQNKKDQQQQKQQKQQQKQQKQTQQKEQQQKKQQQEMTKKDAERILDALKNEEKELQKKRKVQVSGKGFYVEKDW